MNTNNQVYIHIAHGQNSFLIAMNEGGENCKSKYVLEQCPVVSM